MRLVTEFGDITIKKGHSYYWIIQGKVPLEVANKLYNHYMGRKDVRVTGHCMCPAPEKWTTWFDDSGKELIAKNQFDQYLNEDGSRKDPISYVWCVYDDPKYRVVDDPSKEGKGFITSYHIDSTEGLLFFVVTLINELKAQMVF